VIVRFEVEGQLVSETRDWEGPVPQPHDKVTLTLTPNTHASASPAIMATFYVVERRFIREDKLPPQRAEHTILLQLEHV